MYRRLPSIRQPKAFYDVFGIAVIGTLIVTSILTMWHGTFVRIEMAVFSGLLFVWAGWAIYRILSEYSGKTRLSQAP
ncbi:MAG: hypothetical protein A07HN63_02061 [uncultured archaeon A07HN63]|jgi:hypothetical protein|nr:MAG: hypothetical protein A07HN63_02061 [uncultured archaeon A07HN63]